MKKNEVFKFTAPNGVEVTAVVVDVLEPITDRIPDETMVITKHLCYAQNRLFYYDVVHSIKKVIDEDFEASEDMDYYYALEYHSHEVKSSGEYLREVIVNYCILPEYDTILELARAAFDKKEAEILFAN